MYDQIPLKCHACGTETMVAMLNLEKRPYKKGMITLLGFDCEQCGRWETVSLETAAINDLLIEIGKSTIGSPRFQWLMSKALRKREKLLVKIEEEKRHGKSKHSY